jgi:hypothetical protein
MSLSSQIAALPTTPSPAEPGQEHLQLARMEVAADELAQAMLEYMARSSGPAGAAVAAIDALASYVHIRTNGGAAPGVKS